MNARNWAKVKGESDAAVWLAETPREQWPNAIRPGQPGADEGLLNALGIKATARLFGVRGTDPKSGAFARCCLAYSAAWRETVKEAIVDAGSADLTDPRD